MTIKVSQKAASFLAEILEQHSFEEKMHIKINILDAGKPTASALLEYCKGSDMDDRYLEYKQEKFSIFVKKSISTYLDSANIDLKKDDFGESISINAPKIFGKELTDSSSIEEQIKFFIETNINRDLARHKGYINVDKIENNNVYIEFGGGCHGCSMANITLKHGIDSALRKKFPIINNIIDITDHGVGKNPFYTKEPEGV